MGLREKKKLETRQTISHVATELFLAQGFDAVTVEDIAAAANVSKMTVFNYFARKEDLFFDRTDEAKALVQAALAARPRAQSPVEALRQLAHRLNGEKHPLAYLTPSHLAFWEAVAASGSLSARARELADETTASVAASLAEATETEVDGMTRLVAGIIVLAWRTAYTEAIPALRAGAPSKRLHATFLELLDVGFAAAKRAAAGTVLVG